MKILVVAIFALAGSLGLGTQASADQLNYPSGKPFRAIEHDFQHVREDIAGISGDLSDLPGDISEIEIEIGNIKTKLDALAMVLALEVAVNTQICSKGAAQCANFDPEDAQEGNNGLVQLFASVSQGGEPVDGLTFDDFTFSGSFVPPGGSATTLCEEVDCGGSFFLGGNGLYMLFLKPSGDWDDGRYGGNLLVEDPAGGSGMALVTVDIPAAP